MFIVKSKPSRDVLGRDSLGGCQTCKITDAGLGDEIQQMYGGQSKMGGFAKTGLQVVFPILALNMKIPVLGPMLEKIFGGFFKKATKMESCMKWWSDSNIRSMAAGVTPYPINVEEMLPDIAREYRLQHTRSINSDPRIINILNNTRRVVSIQNTFLEYVRGNPDIMGLQCAVQNWDETGLTEISQADVNVYWDQLKESARQKEVYDTSTEIERVLKLYTERIAIREEQVKETRSRGLITEPRGFALPEGVTAVKSGALVLKAGIQSKIKKLIPTKR